MPEEIITVADVGEMPAEVLAPVSSDQDLALEHQTAWRASGFARCSEIMREFRTRYPDRVAQGGEDVLLDGKPVLGAP